MTGIDAYSKWSEVEMMKTITKEALFKKLREWFVRYGIPATIVTDNGPAFESQEFKDFCGQNGIKHIPTSPYHLKTNGPAGRFIRAFIRRMCSSKIDEVKISGENTPYKATGQFPAELQVGKGLPTLLDRTKPHLSIKRDIEIWKQKMYQDRKSKSREFRIGEEVCVRNELNKGWSPGIIDHQTAELSYEVLVAGQRKRKHADQLTKRNGAMDEPNQSEENDTSSSCKRYIPEKWQNYIILPTQKKTVMMAVTKVLLVVSVIWLLMGGSADGGCPVSSTWDNYGGRKLDDGGCLTVVDMFEFKKFYGQVTIDDLHRFCARSFKGGKLLSFTDSQKLQMLDGVNFKQAVASNILIHPGVRIFETNITMKKNVHVEKCGQTERLSCDGYPYEYISNGNGTIDGMLFKCAKKGCCNNTDCDETVSVLTYESALLANFPDLSHGSYCRCLLLNSTFLTWNLSNDHIYDCDDMKCDVFICQNDEYTDCNETRVEKCTYSSEAGECKEFTYEVISEKEYPYGRDCEERNYGESCLCPCVGTWTEWSIASETCGKVVSNRYRRSLDMVSKNESCDGAKISCCKETKRKAVIAQYEAKHKFGNEKGNTQKSSSSAVGQEVHSGKLRIWNKSSVPSSASEAASGYEITNDRNSPKEKFKKQESQGLTSGCQ
ncbi:Uncharacterized protein T06_2529 [Trichinella sp. T6]|nr:Uncharacterized protein T06_2529 [Trichinella sp. T6]